ncbi:carboxylesterase/lipase family protein [Amycolatopsis aidingensis]|uniref:carboxylesterase/lipase family protein n=1 Tax=Amycolatopsis aidingensis TaxID=2842453 RepID=UPI001C0C1192|nr:carboxylesterase/lipase family protein [Amycolatopsis aidingensis]
MRDRLTRHLVPLLVACLTIAGSSAGAPASADPAGGGDPAVVHTESGPLRGTVAEDHRSFQGIPYAAPPVGELRWGSPRPVAPWSEPRDATEPGSPCPQPPGAVGEPPSANEDCLYLNVTTPRHTRGRGLPVMVWIHGGGFTQGNGSMYGGAALARRDVVLVTINYRLGVFGFLAHPALNRGPARHLSGNFGIEDQQAALRWVQRNAAAFGGDPGNITVFGESAGGMSVCTQLSSPLAAGLFHRAIIQSGPCTTRFPGLGSVYPERTDAERTGTEIARLAGCTDPASAAVCLRAKPVRELMASIPPNTFHLAPVVGGPVLPRDPQRALTTGRFHQVPVMQGTTRDEHRLFQAVVEQLTGHPLTEADFRGQVTEAFGAKADEVFARYPLSRYGSPSEALAAVLTDHSWSCPALATDRLLTGHVRTYGYEFADRDAPPLAGFPEPSFPLGAYHGSELLYLFGGLAEPGALTPEQRTLSERMLGYWTRFARTGNPNGHGAPGWPGFRAGAYVQSLAPGRGGIRRVDLGREHQCAFWAS